eukprot:GHVH01001513.1.p1 GENE.GHVH01001513.1~~GHVH01001513.1.p1  ORF type:complete len:377 (+),score=54.82 GHVH01001513.1:41-1132(+)
MQVKDGGNGVGALGDDKENEEGKTCKDTLMRMRILLLACATPLVLNGSEIIGEAWERLGGEAMVHVDYLRIPLRGKEIPVPIFVPITFFGGEVAAAQKWISCQCDALRLIVEEKARLITNEREFLPSYLRLEELNMESALSVCRQQLLAAQTCVKAMDSDSCEKVEWLKRIVTLTIRNQYEDWRLLSHEQADRIAEYYAQLEANPTPKMWGTNFQFLEVLKRRANAVYLSVIEDETIQAVIQQGQFAKQRLDNLTDTVREKSFTMFDYEMMKFARDHISICLSQARHTIDPLLPTDYTRTVFIQTNMVLVFMKLRMDTILAHTEIVSGCDLSFFRDLVQTVPLFTPGMSEEPDLFEFQSTEES